LGIRYVDWGLANNFTDYIEINKNLKRYPELLQYAIEHEEGHKNKFDLAHEFNIDFFKVLSLILFCFRYPKSLVDLFPVRIRKSILYYDINLICLYSVLLMLILLLILIF